MAHPARARYIWKNVRAGDRLTPRAEPDNPFDPDAVALWHKRFHVGYIPARYDWFIASMREGDLHDVLVDTIEPSEHDPDVPFVTLNIWVQDVK